MYFWNDRVKDALHNFKMGNTLRKWFQAHKGRGMKCTKEMHKEHIFKSESYRCTEAQSRRTKAKNDTSTKLLHSEEWKQQEIFRKQLLPDAHFLFH